MSKGSTPFMEKIHTIHWSEGTFISRLFWLHSESLAKNYFCLVGACHTEVKTVACSLYQRSISLYDYIARLYKAIEVPSSEWHKQMALLCWNPVEWAGRWRSCYIVSPIKELVTLTFFQSDCTVCAWAQVCLSALSSPACGFHLTSFDRFWRQ